MNNISVDIYYLLFPYIHGKQYTMFSIVSKTLNELSKEYKKEIHSLISNEYHIDNNMLSYIIDNIQNAFDIFKIISVKSEKYVYHPGLIIEYIDNIIKPLMDYEYNPNECNNKELIYEKYFKNTKYIIEIMKIVKKIFNTHEFCQGLYYVYCLQNIIIYYLSKYYVVENNVTSYCCKVHPYLSLCWTDSIGLRCPLHMKDMIILNTKKYNTISTFAFNFIDQIPWESSNINLYEFFKNIWFVLHIKETNIKCIEFKDQNIMNWFQNNEHNNSQTIRIFGILLKDKEINEDDYVLNYIILVLFKYYVFMILNDYVIQKEMIQFDLFRNYFDISSHILPKVFKKSVKGTLNKFQNVFKKVEKSLRIMNNEF